MTQDILFTCEKHIGLVTLNRPGALNALNLPMIQALYAQLCAWERDSNIHAVVVHAPGSRAFCAGGDVRAIYHLGHDNHAKKMDFFEQEYRLNQFIYDFKKPYIALMDGITMGGGVGISLHGSHKVVSEQFSFAMPETGIGFYPDIGASYHLARCPGYMGMYLGLTGNRIGPGDAYGLGLVDYVIASQQFTTILTTLIDTDLSSDAHKRVNDVLQPQHADVPTIIIDNFQSRINACFQYKKIDLIMAALQAGDSDWHRETYDVLAQKAPLSLHVTCEQLQKAITMSLAECLKMDLCLTSHFMRDGDFIEGVRALLIDKDNTPLWKPARLEDVSGVMIAGYFS